uniref:Uncharacterized protein n=1 Tax=Trichogramma kaykai TaxID=54128 RepID=A0ABD2X398_9HYME
MLNAGSRPRRGPGEPPFAAAASARYIASLWGDDTLDLVRYGARNCIQQRARCACSTAPDVASARAVLMVISAIGATEYTLPLLLYDFYIYEGVKQMMHQLFSLLVEPFDQSRRARASI